jgi:rhamnose utilization protein RhaD (predicted bifunctional aldolase and dehydrogenase)/NAD(P)-dependent dehydrogenase (short-subunit alcohol dehydrogenase family)
MKSNWSDSKARELVNSLEESGVPEDLALRVYTTRLLGRDPKLVLHGGGNTSVKSRREDIVGEQHDVLCVKGSGWDMASIEPEGLPAVKLKPLLRLRGLERLSDEQMVNFERSNLLDSSAPNPSIETLLHAFLPHKFVDHTHATAVLSLTNQPDGEERCRELFSDRAGIVPYVMPGFDLSKKAAALFEADPDIEALILLKHGVFTFADSAQQAYERMIEIVSLVEDRLTKGRSPVFAAAPLPRAISPLAEVAPVVRGACTLSNGTGFDGKSHFVLDFRTGPEILNYVNGKELGRYSQTGVATPDHTLRTRNWPLIVPAPAEGHLDEFKRSVSEAVGQFEERCHSYFQRHAGRQERPLTELDPAPRVVLVPGLGLFGAGRSAKDAAIAADIAESAVETVTDAEAIGAFEAAGEADLFDIEYWSLEQAKLGKSKDRPFTGCVAAVTGGGGAIGAATAQAFAREGAEVAVLDIDQDAARSTCERLPGAPLALRCDVTDRRSVRAAFDAVCERFGGVDVVVSNAGAAWQGKIADVPDSVLRESFELNFFAHQNVAQNAVRVMRTQGTGGTLLFNVTKQAINPGPDFGPYGLPKAATLFLVRQYALEHGKDGIRANAVNADRVRGGINTPGFIALRAKARGLTEEEYMRGNLLGEEVTPEDVAEAFVHQALQRKTTADVTTVDGGNIAAILR